MSVEGGGKSMQPLQFSFTFYDLDGHHGKITKDVSIETFIVPILNSVIVFVTFLNINFVIGYCGHSLYDL